MTLVWTIKDNPINREMRKKIDLPHHGNPRARAAGECLKIDQTSRGLLLVGECLAVVVSPSNKECLHNNAEINLNSSSLHSNEEISLSSLLLDGECPAVKDHHRVVSLLSSSSSRVTSVNLLAIDSSSNLHEAKAHLVGGVSHQASLLKTKSQEKKLLLSNKDGEALRQIKVSAIQGRDRPQREVEGLV